MRLQKDLDFFLPNELGEVNDLVDEMQWEDLINFISLEEAGLEERGEWDAFDCIGASQYNYEYWDGESSEVTE